MGGRPLPRGGPAGVLDPELSRRQEGLEPVERLIQHVGGCRPSQERLQVELAQVERPAPYRLPAGGLAALLGEPGLVIVPGVAPAAPSSPASTAAAGDSSRMSPGATGGPTQPAALAALAASASSGSATP
eukprot:scaffold17861_cov56-Isochrysis_galbana.AAC.2